MATEDYLLQITLLDIDSPVITRTLSVPKTTTFHRLHEAMQIALGWASTHFYSFDVMEPLHGKRDFFTENNISMKLEELPELAEDFGIKSKGSKKVTLEQVLDNPRYAGAAVEYLYDSGDNWEHKVEKIGTGPGNGVIRCVSGSGHGAAEDCGGADGWMELKALYRKVLKADDPAKAIKKLRRDDREMMNWFKNGCSNGSAAGLDPDAWDIADVNARLARLS